MKIMCFILICKEYVFISLNNFVGMANESVIQKSYKLSGFKIPKLLIEYTIRSFGILNGRFLKSSLANT